MSEQAQGAGGRRRRNKVRPDAWTEFRGVSRRRSGKFGAQIRESTGVHKHRWLGTFDTAQDAARAYDAAAVELHGPTAVTNFEQPAAIDDGGVSPLQAEPSGHGEHRQPSGEHIAQIRGSNGKAALSLGGFELTPAEWQQAEELLKDMDMDTTHDNEALVGAAVVLRQISLARHGRDGGRAEPT